ncbi:MAG TPA: carboxypeptidase-like regulatory domain-containing protein [Blastocatellia bacterium]|nr:carboxypeptidase-like regulatory domain-containing protein [Blastocatellia bacterium]
MITRIIRTAISLSCVTGLLWLPALAQSGQLEGVVKVKSESGNPVTVAGATIEIVRLDIKGHWETKTDKNGRYVYLGLPLIGTFLIIATGPGMQPTWQNGVKISQMPVLDFLAERGDGSRPTAEQVQAAIKGQGQRPRTGGSQESEKATSEANAKAQKEYAEKKKEADELQASFDSSREHFNKGVELKNTKDYTTALSEFEQAAMIDPTKHAEFVQLSHRANANVAEVNYLLGVDLYNSKKKNESKERFQAALAAIKKAITVAPNDKNLSGSTDLLVYYDIYAKIARLLVDNLQVADLVDEAVQTVGQAEALDPQNKLKWALVKADLYRGAFKQDDAVAAYKAILAADPNNLDAMYGAGLTLLASVEKEKLQESANFLADFVAKAPASDPKWSQKVADAKSTLEALKNDQKVEAEKPSTRRRRP